MFSLLSEVMPNKDMNLKSAEQNYEANRNFIGAIISQAVSDACSFDPRNDPEGARRFIDKDNILFRYYCEILDFNPDWVAKKLRKQIEDWDNKKRMASPYLFTKLKEKKNGKRSVAKRDGSSLE